MASHRRAASLSPGTGCQKGVGGCRCIALYAKQSIPEPAVTEFSRFTGLEGRAQGSLCSLSLVGRACVQSALSWRGLEGANHPPWS